MLKTITTQTTHGHAPGIVKSHDHVSGTIKLIEVIMVRMFSSSGLAGSSSGFAGSSSGFSGVYSAGVFVGPSIYDTTYISFEYGNLILQKHAGEFFKDDEVLKLAIYLEARGNFPAEKIPSILEKSVEELKFSLRGNVVGKKFGL